MLVGVTVAVFVTLLDLVSCETSSCSDSSRQLFVLPALPGRTELLSAGAPAVSVVIINAHRPENVKQIVEAFEHVTAVCEASPALLSASHAAECKPAALHTPTLAHTA